MYFVADSKAENGALGKQYSGTVRCKHCALRFNDNDTIVDYCQCRSIAQTPINMDMVWKRAMDKKRRIIDREPHGLKRICGFFYDYCSDRPNFSIPPEHASFFQMCTLDNLRSLVLIDKLRVIDDAFSVYRTSDSTLSELEVIDGVFRAVVSSGTSKTSVKFSIASVWDDINRDSENLLYTLLVIINLHYNRDHAEMSLSDFGLQHLTVISDAPHNITGSDDRLYNFIISELSSDSVLLADRYDDIIRTPRSAMNHSDKRLANFRAFEVFFGETEIETGPPVDLPSQSIDFVSSSEDSLLHDILPVNDVDGDMIMQDTLTQTAETSQLSATDASEQTDLRAKHVVTASQDNLRWIILLQMLLIRQCSLSEAKRKMDQKREAFILHCVSFLLFVLCVERYGADIVSLYLHDIAIPAQEMITDKIKELTASGYSDLIAELPCGDILLNLTGDVTSDLYIPLRSMLCKNGCPEQSDTTCKNLGCTKKAKSKQCALCRLLYSKQLQTCRRRG